jgi:hypothetical protein
LGVTVFLFQRAIFDFFQYQSLPHFENLPIFEAIIAIPSQIIQKLRTIQFPEVTIDSMPLQVWVGSVCTATSSIVTTVASFLFTNFLNVVQFFNSLISIGVLSIQQAAEAIITIFFSLYDTVTLALDFWAATFFVPAVWFAKLFMQHSVSMYRAGQTTLFVSYALVVLIINFISYTIMQIFSLVVWVIEALIQVVLGVLSAIDNFVAAIVHAVSVQIDKVTSVFQPYFISAGKALRLSVSEFKKCIDTFGHDFQGIVATYEHNAKN